MGLNYPIPTFPEYLSSQIPESCQSWAQVPTRLDKLSHPGGDMCTKSKESWTWLVSILQFWGDEASITDGIVYGGRECPISTLAEYILNTINPRFEPRSQIIWVDVVMWTAWLSKRLHGITAGQEKTVRHQALPVAGMSSELKVTLERWYSEHILNALLGRDKVPTEKPSTPSPKGAKPLSPTSLIGKSWMRRLAEDMPEEVNPGTRVDPHGAKRSRPQHRAPVSNSE